MLSVNKEKPGNNGDKVTAKAVLPHPEVPEDLLDPFKTLTQQSVLPGFGGMPFRGTVPDLKEDDPRRPEPAYQAFVRVFDLSNTKDLEYYEKIYQVAYNGFAVICAEERAYDKQKRNWRVFLRWAWTYSHMPEEVPHRGA